MADNRRSSFRHSVDLPVRLVVAGKPEPSDQRLGNLSMGGAYILGVSLPMGQRMTVTFAVPTQEAAIEVGAVARWIGDDGVGIQFDGLRARDTWALGEYLKQLSK